MTPNGNVYPCQWDFTNLLGTVDTPFDIIHERGMVYHNGKMAKRQCLLCKHADVCKSACGWSDLYVSCPLQKKYTYVGIGGSQVKIDMKSKVISNIKAAGC